MTYKTEYILDEWIGDVWTGEIPIFIYVDEYSVGNDTYDDEFGMVRLPDYIEDITWKVDLEKTDPVWLKKYTVDQMESFINDDSLFFDVEVKKVEEFLTKEAQEDEVDRVYWSTQ
jgi:hypothetical protein